MPKGPKEIDYRPALYSIRNALYAGILIDIERNNILADLSRLSAAVEAVSAGVSALVDAIRNPAADGDQAGIDAAAASLEAAVAALAEGLALEQAEDGASEPEAPAE